MQNFLATIDDKIVKLPVLKNIIFFTQRDHWITVLTKGCKDG